MNEEFRTHQAAIEVLRSYQLRHPKDEDCAFVIGRNLFHLEDKSCLPEFELSYTKLSLSYDSCWFAYQFLINNDQESSAEIWKKRAETAEATQAEAEHERQYLTVDDLLVTANTEEETAKKLIEKLQSSTQVSKAWIVAKVTKHHTNAPAYAVAVKSKGITFSDESLKQKLAVEFEAFDAWIIPLAGDYKPLAKHIINHGEQVV